MCTVKEEKGCFYESARHSRVLNRFRDMDQSVRSCRVLVFSSRSVMYSTNNSNRKKRTDILLCDYVKCTSLENMSSAIIAFDRTLFLGVFKVTRYYLFIK